MLIPDQEKVDKHLFASVKADMPPGVLGHYHFYQGDVFVELAFNQDEAGNRDIAQNALQMAAQYYDAAGAGFRLLVSEEEQGYWGRLGDTIFVAGTYFIGAGGGPGIIQRRDSQRLALVEAQALRVDDTTTLAETTETLSKSVRATLTCYVSAVTSSLEQCAGNE